MHFVHMHASPSQDTSYNGEWLGWFLTGINEATFCSKLKSAQPNLLNIFFIKAVASMVAMPRCNW